MMMLVLHKESQIQVLCWFFRRKLRDTDSVGFSEGISDIGINCWFSRGNLTDIRIWLVS